MTHGKLGFPPETAAQTPPGKLPSEYFAIGGDIWFLRGAGSEKKKQVARRQTNLCSNDEVGAQRPVALNAFPAAGLSRVC